jgi:hypothetical protein
MTPQVLLHRHTPLDEVHMRQLTEALDDPEDRVVCRELLMNARIGGMESVGEVVRSVEAMTPYERKSVADRIRRRLGLKTSGVKAMEEASRLARAKAADVSTWQLCAVCGAIPTKELGVPIEVSCRRYFCPEHEGMAQPGDLAPRDTQWRYSPSGAIVEVNPAEVAREEAQAESRRRRHEQRLAEREFEAERMRREEEARDAAFRAELPEFLRRNP